MTPNPTKYTSLHEWQAAARSARMSKEAEALSEALCSMVEKGDIVVYGSYDVAEKLMENLAHQGYRIVFQPDSE